MTETTFVTNRTDSAPAGRWRTRALAALGVAALAGALFPAAAQASPHPPRDPAGVRSHPYRHGVVPTLGTGLPNLGVNNLRYGGGTNRMGVTTGAPKVYLVFWGSQWGPPAPLRTATPP